jgi:hypothetical protein
VKSVAKKPQRVTVLALGDVSPQVVLLVESYTARHASLLGNMRTIGMIGGLGPEFTIDYYRFIIARYRARGGPMEKQGRKFCVLRTG